MKKIKFLAISIGIIYIWFGLLKFFPAVSPAEELATETINQLTFELIPKSVGYLMLAVLEVLIGLGLMIPRLNKLSVIVALCHMVLTFTPLFLFPELVFGNAPFSFTIVGQYIMKNIIIICALLMLLPTKQEQKLFRLSGN
jgi:uncharacterized membrane protein YkgB